MNRYPLIKHEECGECKRQHKSESAADWLPLFLAYLAYLRATRQPPPPEVSTLRLLIIVIGLVSVVVALVASGASDQVANVLHNWPLIH